MIYFLCWFIHCLLILLSVAFFTLFERKVIGSFHIRLGPNKVSFIGLVQPLLDAFKLIIKQNLTPLQTNKFIYNLSPHAALFLSYMVWITIPRVYFLFSLNFSLIIFFCLGSFIVFPVLIAGWSSNSKYSLIGSLRSVAQSVSYESVFSTLVVLLAFIIISFSIRSLLSQSSLFSLLLFPIWFICTLAETHRAPFDFSEAESELVSGFNTEYSGMYFAFLFLSEYGVLLFSCVLMSYIFILPFVFYSVVTLTVASLLLSFLCIWVRITFCRFRYDILIITSWKVLLPFSLNLFVFSSILFILL